MEEAALTSESIAPSSTPPPIFSDDARRASSPPSSPPGFPWERANASIPTSTAPVKPRAQSAFAVLGKRKALEPLSDNARPIKKAAPSSSKPQNATLTQMQMSLGQEVQKKCKTCGMEYVPSSAEDRKLHDEYHKQNTEGFDVGRDFISKARPKTTFPGAKKGDTICVLDCADTPARKRRGQAVLDIVQRELGAVPISEDEIWRMKKNDFVNVSNCNFRAYLYIRGTKCIGFLLEQKISEAYRVTNPPTPPTTTTTNPSDSTAGALSTLKARHQSTSSTQNLPLTLSTHQPPSRLGISRIWTSPTHRNQNIATNLLDTAFSQYKHRNILDERERKTMIREALDNPAVAMVLQARMDAEPLRIPVEQLQSKDFVAFSQPTEAGTRLARRWFGRRWGWGVYVD